MQKVQHHTTPGHLQCQFQHAVGAEVGEDQGVKEDQDPGECQ